MNLRTKIAAQLLTSLFDDDREYVADCDDAALEIMKLITAHEGPLIEPRVPLAVAPIVERIGSRMVVLGNKTHSTKSSADEKTRAAHGIRELVKLREWIEDRL